jgi:pSer/pThr/pTyr-binding forkhead associated (FHA) protein
VAYLTQYSGSVPVIKFNIDQSVMTIGQDLEMDICVPEDGISENHATIEAAKRNESYRFTIKSREDEPEITINGETVSIAELKDGDWIVIGDVEFQFSDDGIHEIKHVETPIVEKVAEKAKTPGLQLAQNEVVTTPVELTQELQVEAEPMVTDTLHDDHRFSRRLNFF